MVKFQKQFEQQLVPEWKEEYCDYKQLKREVRRIKDHFELVKGTKRDGKTSHLLDKLKLLGLPIVALPVRLVNVPRFLCFNVEPIMVHLRQFKDEEEFYETEVLSTLFSTQLATEFFRRLDAQLNMVNKFYKLKEEEYNLQAYNLQLQMTALLELRKSIAEGKPDDGRKCLKKVTYSPCQRATSPVYVEDVMESKDQLQFAEKTLRATFIDLYRELVLLNNFSSSNKMAFGKILKKYDKVTGWNASLPYLRVVESSYFASSDKMLKLMEKLEDLFTEHITGKSYRLAMVYLKPVKQISSHVVSFSYVQGILTGCAVGLLVVYAMTLFFPPSKFSPVDHPRATSMADLLPLLGTVGLLLAHMHMMGWNVYVWRRTRINYAVLFEWAPRSHVQCQEALLLCTGLTTMWLLVLLVLQLYPNLPHADLVPPFFLLATVMLFSLPFDVCHKSGRVGFLRSLARVVVSPFPKVPVSDSILADQFCSQVKLFRNIEYLSCYYLGGYFHSGQRACKDDHRSQILQYVVPILPFWWRLMQCTRRWMEDRDLNNMVNGGKYLSSIFATIFRVAYLEQERTTTTMLYLFVFSTLVSVLYSLYWDIVMDWGLMQPGSVNPWLRDHLILKNKSIYYCCMVVNMILRFTWPLELLLKYQQGMTREVTDLTLAFVELFRRGIWNFFRLEWEHVSPSRRVPRALKSTTTPS